MYKESLIISNVIKNVRKRNIIFITNVNVLANSTGGRKHLAVGLTLKL
jgi:hypothetical protein